MGPRGETALDAARRLEPALRAFTEIFESPLGTAGIEARFAFVAKESFDVAGRVNRNGGRHALAGEAAQHALAIQRLMQAGGELIGRTTQPQLAYGGWGTNALLGAPRNPWDARVHRVTGGSSSGSAAAVAAGIVGIALGSDTGGSVRIPASLCGVVGVKPAQDRYPRAGLCPLSTSLDTVGLLARDVATARLHHPILTGATSVAPITTGTPARPVACVRIPADAACDADVAHALRHATERLRLRGIGIVEVDPPWEPVRIVERAGTILACEAWDTYGARLEAWGDAMDPAVRHRLIGGRNITRRCYEAARTQRTEDRARFERWLAPYEALLTPTTPITARRLDEVDESSLILSTWTRAGTYFDLFAVSVPQGQDGSGLPIGVQVYARGGDEQRGFDLAALLEASLPEESRRVAPVST